MRVLLIYSNRTRILVPAPPIGLSYVASAAREAGHEVRFVDLMLSADPDGELLRAVTGGNPEVIGISIRNIDTVIPQRLSWQLGELGGMLREIREVSDATIVLGGPAASVLGGRCLEMLDADFSVVGEGEVAFPKLLKALEEGSDYTGIEGLCYRSGGAVVCNEPVRRTEFGPSRMEDWVDWRAYDRAGGTFAIHTKRGCPLKCLYCNYPGMEGTEIRRRDVGEIVDELERVSAELGPRTFEFTDSTFNIPSSHAIEICEEILRRGLKVKLSAVGVNPLGVTPELFPLMARAGFISMVISAEAGNETMLANLRKGFTMEHVRQTARFAADSGIRSLWFFLLGGPGETEQTVEETVRFVETHLNSRRFLSVLMTGIRILPGTALARLGLEEGWLSPETDLARPAFYFAPGLSEKWVLDRINRAIANCPTIVHGGEESGSAFERMFYGALRRMGFAPPYIRFLPWFLSMPPLPTLRARHTGVPTSEEELFLPRR